MFFTHGIKAITMDEIARKQGMSKKTLYQYFSNKKELVRETFFYYLEAQEKAITDIRNKNPNAIDELYQIYDLKCQRLQVVNPALPLDLKRAYSNTWSLCLAHKDQFLYRQVIANFKRGIEDSLYHNDFNIEIVARVFVHQLHIIYNNMLYATYEYSLNTIIYELFQYHVWGISTEKGLYWLKRLMGNVNNP